MISSMVPAARDIFNAAAGYDVLFVGDEEDVTHLLDPDYLTGNDSVEIVRTTDGIEVNYQTGNGDEHTVSINGVEEVVISNNREDYIPDLLAAGAGGNRSTLQGDFEDSYVCRWCWRW